MNHRAFGLSENLDKCNDAARIFGESFQLEDSLAKLLGENWHLDGYVDDSQIEHIRMYRTAEEVESSEQWEVLMYDEDEAPLELLMF